MDPGAHRLAEQEQFFAEGEARFEIPNRVLAREDFRYRSGGEQPRCECFFSGACAGGADELEERCLSEEIEIARVGMERVEKPISGFAVTGPAILETGESA